MMSTMPGYCNPTISCSGFGTCDPISASKAFHALDVWWCRKVSYIIESYLQLAITQKLPLLSSWRMLEKATESVAQWHRKRALRCCVHLRQWSLQLWLQWCLCGSKSSVFSGKFWKRNSCIVNRCDFCDLKSETRSDWCKYPIWISFLCNLSVSGANIQAQTIVTLKDSDEQTGCSSSKLAVWKKIWVAKLEMLAILWQFKGKIWENDDIEFETTSRTDPLPPCQFGLATLDSLEGTEFCSLATGASTPTCTCKHGFSVWHYQWRFGFAKTTFWHN